jgi:5'-nucleotidase
LTIDLVLVGPNEDPNNGPYLYTVSGTLAATYVSVERGFSAVAVSAGNTTHRSYTTNTGDPLDPANIAANVRGIYLFYFIFADYPLDSPKLTASLVRALAKTKKDGQRILPLGVGLK